MKVRANAHRQEGTTKEELRAGRRSLAARHARARRLQRTPPPPLPAAPFPLDSKRGMCPKGWGRSLDSGLVALATPSNLATLLLPSRREWVHPRLLASGSGFGEGGGAGAW